jgi:ribonuclease HI
MVEWRENQVEAPTNQSEHWVMYFDGSLKLGGGGAGVLFISSRGEQLKYVFQILFEVSNNEAEYEALLHGLRLAVSWASSDYSSTMTPYRWFNKSTRSGTSTRTTWMPMLQKYASSRTSSRGWRFTM